MGGAGKLKMGKNFFFNKREGVEEGGTKIFKRGLMIGLSGAVG